MHVYALVVWFLLSSPLQNSPNGHSQKAETEPPRYRMELVYIFDDDKTEHIFVIGNSGFKTVVKLKEFIGRLPSGTTLEWAPGCERLGDEPLLSSEEDMEAFKSYCEEKGIKFVLIPSG